ncbi:MAG: hypothetical protein OEX08_03720 [Candidatus Nomurabacteria bacterium]|nr:hypothetical protein [Candidatus Nomurabacteria bacterium]
MKNDEIDNLLDEQEITTKSDLPDYVISGTDEVVERILGESPWVSEPESTERIKLRELQNELRQIKDKWKKSSQENGSDNDETLLAREAIRTVEMRIRRALDEYRKKYE